ncbi:MAG TPA: ABC transporter substrate-binding protein [Gemmatimonadales bacterium]|nr:ABC transporter substrate-binding protein [Gemmatimonadales bacterium]
MTRHGRWRVSAVLSVLALGGAACGRTTQPAIVGCALPNWSAPVVRLVAAELAASPDSGRILLVCDTMTSEPLGDEAIQVAQRLVDQRGLVGVVGHGGSHESLVAAPVYNEHHVVELVPTGTSRELTAVGPWTFALSPNDSVEGKFIAEYVTDSLRAPSVTILYANDDYGAGLARGVEAALARRGIPVLASIPVGPASSIDTLIRAELAVRPPGAFLAATRPTRTGQIVRALRSAGSLIPVVAGDGALIMPQLATAAGDATARLSVVTFWIPQSPDSASRAFVRAFRAIAHTDPHASQALTYDAMRLLITAVQHVGTSSQGVRGYLESLGRARPPYQGITGPIAFPAGAARGLLMVHLDHGDVVPGGAP